jgi:hypothetical protein
MPSGKIPPSEIIDGDVESRVSDVVFLWKTRLKDVLASMASVNFDP